MIIKSLTLKRRNGKKYRFDNGGMAEWFKAAVLKTVECNSSVGSNPTPSAINAGGRLSS
jgi:hypothetical protein